MRGLEIRVMQAKANVLGAFDFEKAELLNGLAMEEAQKLGAIDFSTGHSGPPILFHSEPVLINSWWDGIFLASEMSV